MNDIIEMLTNYRMHCASKTSPSILVMPENIRMLPLNLLSAMKTPAFRLLTLSNLDEKIAQIYSLASKPESFFAYFFYPRIYEVTDIGQSVSPSLPPFSIISVS